MSLIIEQNASLGTQESISIMDGGRGIIILNCKVWELQKIGESLDQALSKIEEKTGPLLKGDEIMGRTLVTGCVN